MAKKPLRSCLWSIGIAIALLAAVWIARAPILSAMGQWLDVGVPPQRADYAMILTGDENTRPFVAATLVKKGWAQQALATQVKNPPGVADDAELACNENIRRIMRHQGVPADQFLTLPGEATTTFDEAQALAAFLETRPDAKVLIVTNHYHTRRAKWIFSRVLPSTVSISMISAPTDNFELREWWKNEKGWGIVTSEYLKIVFYDFRYGYFGIACLTVLLFSGCILAYLRYRRHRKATGERMSESY
jgi:uncharacterized SAM-binding protein YcdF (DUF218 family)